MWRLVQLVAGGGLLVALGAGALMVWPLLWPPDPDASVQLVNGRLVGEATGYVGHIDHDARTVDVSASLVGWRPVVLVVNDSTAILVHNRLGGFGDLWKDMPVRVAYEVVGNRRLARSIEVVSGDGQATGVVTGAATPALVAPPLVAPPAAVSAPPMDPAPTPAGAADPGLRQSAPDTPPPSAVASPPPEKLPPEPASREEPPPAKPALVPEPSRRAEMPQARPSPLPGPPRHVEAPPGKPSPAAVPPPREAPPVRGPQVGPAPSSPRQSSSQAETETGDGGAAAVDWLLKESRGTR